MRATVALSVFFSLVLQQVIVTVDPKRAQTESERQRDPSSGQGIAKIYHCGKLKIEMRVR